MLSVSESWNTSAVVPSAPRQPEMVPSSLTNMKASPLKLPEMPANTWPVTLPSPGMVTTSGVMEVMLVAGLTVYKVDTPVPLSDTQNGELAECEMPHALTRFRSVIWAGCAAWSSVTRFVVPNDAAAAGNANPKPTNNAQQHCWIGAKRAFKSWNVV